MIWKRQKSTGAPAGSSHSCGISDDRVSFSRSQFSHLSHEVDFYSPVFSISKGLPKALEEEKRMKWATHAQSKEEATSKQKSRP